MVINRGDIYYADLNPGIGSEQKGVRPVLVLQNNIGNLNSTTIIIAPITIKNEIKKMLPTHVKMDTVEGINEKSILLLEQIRTIDKRRLVKYVGKSNEDLLLKINIALKISLDLLRMKRRCTDYELINLCPRCARDFYYVYEQNIKRENYNQEIKETCDYCGCGFGFTYSIYSDKSNKNVLI